MSKHTPHPQSIRGLTAFLLGALVAPLAIALVAEPAEAAHPYTGAQIVYVGLEEDFAPEEGFTGFQPVGLRGIRLGEPKLKARALTADPNDSAPAASPDRRWIAFSGAGGIMLMRSSAENIYTMRPNGNRLQSLTSGGDHPLSSRFKLSEPAFSPSGRFLLVTGRDSGHTELTLIDLADRSRLFGTGGLEGEAAAWVP